MQRSSSFLFDQMYVTFFSPSLLRMSKQLARTLTQVSGASQCFCREIPHCDVDISCGNPCERNAVARKTVKAHDVQ